MLSFPKHILRKHISNLNNNKISTVILSCYRQNACVTRASRERFFHAIKKINFIVNQCVITHRTRASSVSHASLARYSRVTRQNQIKSDFIACRVRIAWKSREYDVGNKVFPNTVTVPTIRKNAILF